MIAKLRDETVPDYQKQLKEITGSKIEYDVDWDSFADSSAAMENIEDKGLKVLNDIFQEITSDKIGKDAVAESIQKIHLSHGDDANISSFTLNDGVLNMPWDWKGWAGSFFPDSVREKIESLL